MYCGNCGLETCFVVELIRTDFDDGVVALGVVDGGSRLGSSLGSDIVAMMTESEIVVDVTEVNFRKSLMMKSLGFQSVGFLSVVAHCYGCVSFDDLLIQKLLPD